MLSNFQEFHSLKVASPLIHMFTEKHIFYSVYILYTSHLELLADKECTQPHRQHGYPLLAHCNSLLKTAAAVRGEDGSISTSI